MRKLLIVSGDSFTDRIFRSSAHPLLDCSWPKWPEILAEKLNMRAINLARAGQGNEYIYSTLQDFILRVKDKDKIGLVIAPWSECHRKDYQVGNLFVPPWHHRGRWHEQRVDPNGDLHSWVRKSLRLYMSFEMMCERYNLPYLQWQMIPLYLSFIRGLPPTEQEIVFEGKTMDDTLTYPGNKVKDLEDIIKMFLEYEDILNIEKFMGWPTVEKLGGWSMNRAVLGYGPEDQTKLGLVISEYDSHPNKKGQEKIAEYIYDRFG